MWHQTPLPIGRDPWGITHSIRITLHATIPSTRQRTHVSPRHPHNFTPTILLNLLYNTHYLST